MKLINRLAFGAAFVAGLYIILPLMFLIFTAVAFPFDEESYGTQTVDVGPRPRWWVPEAAHRFNIPGGFDYDPSGWLFMVWRPLCVVYVKAKGYALPAKGTR